MYLKLCEMSHASLTIPPRRRPCPCYHGSTLQGNFAMVWSHETITVRMCLRLRPMATCGAKRNITEVARIMSVAGSRIAIDKWTGRGDVERRRALFRVRTSVAACVPTNTHSLPTAVPGEIESMRQLDTCVSRRGPRTAMAPRWVYTFPRVCNPKCGIELSPQMSVVCTPVTGASGTWTVVSTSCASRKKNHASFISKIGKKSTGPSGRHVISERALEDDLAAGSCGQKTKPTLTI